MNMRSQKDSSNLNIAKITPVSDFNDYIKKLLDYD